MICEPQLLTGALYSTHVTWYTFFMLGGGTCNNYAENISRHRFSWDFCTSGLANPCRIMSVIKNLSSHCGWILLFKTALFSTSGVAHTFFDWITMEPLNVAVATVHTRCTGDPETESKSSDRLFWLTVTYLFSCTGKLWNCGPTTTLT